MSRLRVGITGAGGQIGSLLIERLSAHSALEVIAICRNTVSAGMLDPLGCSVRIGSIAEPDSANKLLGDCNAVVHCALAVGLPKQARLMNKTMIRCFSHVRAIKTIIYLSSVAVYGSCIDQSVNTYARPRPDTLYGKDKLLCERQILAVFPKTERRCFVLRLGHVYGANQAMSKNILAWARNNHFRLPFNGQLLSNAIHSEMLCNAVFVLLSNLLESGVYNLTDQPHQTWRQVFDLHTEAVGLAAVQGMSAEMSGKIKEQYIKIKERSQIVRIIEEGVSWIRSLPSQMVGECPSLREFAYSELAHMPLSCERWMKAKYRNMSVKRDIQGVVSGDYWTEPEPWLLSDAMPGPYLDFPSASDWQVFPERMEKLARWFESWAYPKGAWIT